MTTFAHVGGGKALDCQEDSNLDAYLLRFTAVVIYGWMIAGHVIKQVPNGTQHGATDNGDGTYTNPPPPPSQDET